MPECRRDRGDIFFLVRNVITRKQEQVGLEPVSNLDRPCDVGEVRERAVMNIGEVNDAKTVQLFRKSRELDADVLEGKTVRFIDRRLRDLRNVPGKLTQRLLCQNERVNALGDAWASLSGRLHKQESLRKIHCTNFSF